MGKVSVRKCDECDDWDRQYDPVIRVTIIAVRRDLCRTCRVEQLMAWGVDQETAKQKCLAQEEQRAAGGVQVAAPDVDDDVSTDDPDQISLDDVGTVDAV